jgi:hypothetical protein
MRASPYRTKLLPVAVARSREHASISANGSLPTKSLVVEYKRRSFADAA